jgi:hypothetical protein
MSAEPKVIVNTGPDPALLEAILVIAREREALLAALRVALEDRDIAKASKLARHLCGLSEE